MALLLFGDVVRLTPKFVGSIEANQAIKRPSILQDRKAGGVSGSAWLRAAGFA
jgi:hypothetical protein